MARGNVIEQLLHGISVGDITDGGLGKCLLISGQGRYRRLQLGTIAPHEHRGPPLRDQGRCTGLTNTGTGTCHHSNL